MSWNQQSLRQPCASAKSPQIVLCSYAQIIDVGGAGDFNVLAYIGTLLSTLNMMTENYCDTIGCE